MNRFLGCCVLMLLPRALPAAELVLDPMVSVERWAVTGQRISYSLGDTRLEPVQQPARPDTSGSLRLTYDLERRNWVGLQWKLGPLPGLPQKLSFWVDGDNSGHRLVAMLEDLAGQFFEVPLAVLDFTGWREIDVPLDPATWRAVRSYPEAPQAAHGPVALREIRVVKGRPQPMAGSIVLAQLRLVTDLLPIHRVQLKAATTAPANVFYAPAPAVVELTLDNANPQPITGTLEVALTDWQGRTEVVSKSETTLPADKATTRRIEIPAANLGSFTAWFRFSTVEGQSEARLPLAVSRPATRPAALDRESPFGMGLYLNRYKTPAERALALRLGQEAGVRWTREGVGVAHVEPRRGVWTWDAARWIDSPRGGAIDLQGSRPLVVADAPALDRPCVTGELTIDCWLRLNQLDYPQRWQNLLSKGEDGKRQCNIYWDQREKRLGASLGDGQRQWNDVLCTKADWKAGAWYRVQFTYRRADKTAHWWIDGQAAGGGQIRLKQSLVANDAPLQIARGLDCALDELTLYDRALSPDQLAAAQPIARWPFDEKSGLRAADASGHGLDVELPLFPLDGQLKEAEQAGIAAYLLVKGTPAWMAGRALEGVVGPLNVAPQIDLWSEALKVIAQRFTATGIGVWEVWNEPNIESFWSPQPDPEEYYRVLAATYRAVKAVNPQALVLGCSLAGPHGVAHRPPYEFLEGVFARGGVQVMDAVSIHPYRQPRSPEESGYVEDLQTVAAMTARAGRPLPIWITEVGWPNGTGGSTEAWSAKMLPRAYLLAIAAGVKNVTWYDFHDDGVDPSYNEHHFGIVRHDFTPKPAYFAYRTMALELDGMRQVRAVPAGEGVTLLVFSGGPAGAASQRTAVLWAHRGTQSLALRIPGTQDAEFVDLMGNVRRQPHPPGAVMIDVDESAVFLRNVPENLEVIRPVTAQPAAVKIVRGESANVTLEFRNPFGQMLSLSSRYGSVAVPAGGTRSLKIAIAHEAAGKWQPLEWVSPDRKLVLVTPLRVAAVTGQQDPIFQHVDEVTRPTLVPNSANLAASDEVTIACRLRASGPTPGWQAPVTKWKSDVARNFGLFLSREKGEPAFSATFTNLPGKFRDITSGQSLFDGQWHVVAVTYSRFDAQLCFYVDGKLVQRETVDGGALQPVDAPLMLAAGFPAAKNGQAPAAVKDIRIWNRALGVDELMRLFAAKPGRGM